MSLFCGMRFSTFVFYSRADPSPERHSPQSRKRVLGIIARHGLARLSAYEVSLLLDNQPEAQPFLACFKKHKVNLHVIFQAAVFVFARH